MSEKTSLRICLVDDDEDYYVITRDYLDEMKGFSCDVTWVSTYHEARNKLIGGGFDICLLDHHLGEQNGLQLLREMRRLDCRIPAIMLTGQSDHEIDLEAMQAGAEDYLIKGQIDAEKLERSMRYVLKKHGVQEELRQSRDSLGAAKIQLEEALKKINEEMETAKRVQMSLLPRDLHEIKDLEIEATYLPCGSIGGDLYDVIKLDDSRTAVFVLDACGHGVPAAFISAMAKVSFSRFIRPDESCAAILQRVNNELCAFMPEGRFLTVFLAIIDTAEKKIDFARAAHPAALLFRKSKGTIEYLTTRGSFVGLSTTSHFDESSVSLESGDLIVLYSDGLIESSDGEGHFFEKKGVETALIDAMLFSNAKPVDTIMEERTVFTHNLPQHDDITLLTIRIR